MIQTTGAITAAVLFLGLIFLAPGIMNAQLVPPPIGSTPPIPQNSPENAASQAPPGAVVVPPSQQHGPGQAQIQSDIAAHGGIQAAIAHIQNIENQIQARLGNDTSPAHRAQTEEQMTQQRLIDCPAVSNPGHACFLTPKPTTKPSPPIG